MNERGASLGRNTGAKNARFERLVFLDADDRIKPDFLEKSLVALEKSGLWVAGGQIRGGENLMTRLGIGIFNLGMLVTQYFFPDLHGRLHLQHENGARTYRRIRYANKAMRGLRLRKSREQNVSLQDASGKIQIQRAPLGARRAL